MSNLLALQEMELKKEEYLKNKYKDKGKDKGPPDRHTDKTHPKQRQTRSPDPTSQNQGTVPGFSFFPDWLKSWQAT